MTMVEGRMSRHGQFSRNFTENKNNIRGGNHLPYFRSKSANELDAESEIAQFRPILNHKAIIDHTYNIERSRSRSKSRERFKRKRVVTTPLSLLVEHRERTLYTDRYRGLKDIYTESGLGHVEQQFYERLTKVKIEEYKSVSKSRDKGSKHRQKTLPKQIEDLKKINTRYGRRLKNNIILSFLFGTQQTRQLDIKM